MMNIDDKHTGSDPSQALAPDNNSKTSTEHEYTMLGESGLYEDEEGNFYTSDELFGSYKADPEKFGGMTSGEYFQSTCPKPVEPQMPDWYSIYDPRYCGPSREEYVDRMTRQWQMQQLQKRQQQEKEDTETAQTETVQTETTQAETSQTETSQTVTSQTETSQTVTSQTEAATQTSSFNPTNHPDPFPGQSSSGSSESLQSDQNNPSASSDSEINDRTTYKLKVKKRTIIFYAIFIIIFIAYFFLLIIKLVREVIHLFEI